MSSFAIRLPWPSFATISTALSKWLNCAADSEDGMKSFIDLPAREDRSVIVLNLLGSFLGIMPIGEVRKFSNGGSRNGPAMRSSCSSIRMF